MIPQPLDTASLLGRLDAIAEVLAADPDALVR